VFGTRNQSVTKFVSLRAEISERLRWIETDCVKMRRRYKRQIPRLTIFLSDQSQTAVADGTERPDVPSLMRIVLCVDRVGRSV